MFDPEQRKSAGGTDNSIVVVTQPNISLDNNNGRWEKITALATFVSAVFIVWTFVQTYFPSPKLKIRANEIESINLVPDSGHTAFHPGSENFGNKELYLITELSYGNVGSKESRLVIESVQASLVLYEYAIGKTMENTDEKEKIYSVVGVWCFLWDARGDIDSSDESKLFQFKESSGAVIIPGNEWRTGWYRFNSHSAICRNQNTSTVKNIFEKSNILDEYKFDSFHGSNFPDSFSDDECFKISVLYTSSDDSDCNVLRYHWINEKKKNYKEVSLGGFLSIHYYRMDNVSSYNDEEFYTCRFTITEDKKSKIYSAISDDKKSKEIDLSFIDYCWKAK